MKDMIQNILNERADELDYEIFDGVEVSHNTLMFDSDNIFGSTATRFQSIQTH